MHCTCACVWQVTTSSATSHTIPVLKRPEPHLCAMNHGRGKLLLSGIIALTSHSVLYVTAEGTLQQTYLPTHMHTHLDVVAHCVGGTLHQMGQWTFDLEQHIGELWEYSLLMDRELSQEERDRVSEHTNWKKCMHHQRINVKNTETLRVFLLQHRLFLPYRTDTQCCPFWTIVHVVVPISLLHQVPYTKFCLWCRLYACSVICN